MDAKCLMKFIYEIIKFIMRFFFGFFKFFYNVPKFEKTLKEILNKIEDLKQNNIGNIFSKGDEGIKIFSPKGELNGIFIFNNGNNNKAYFNNKRTKEEK
ncbi:hypothetical protein [Candidatus Phytoplasma pruni]|uniref:Uncharacterized protein n=1 Tax=Candidatus Phytoplasma pruni TaxID=479893 RepID=A0A851HIV7_9MOLU|nr:hypothetical protein [Candidatus Phytoplasma pruni]NWN45486.1 hypothetical protein [Candidatus Phytoplasma pruni]